MKKKLENFKTTEDNLLFWIKEYIAFKALEAFQNSSSNTVNDIIDSIDKIKNAKDIDEIKLNTNLLVRDGLSSLSRINNAVYQLYIYSVSKIKSIRNIDTNMLQGFKEWLTIGTATKKGYVDAVLELITFIQNSNTDKYEFDVEESIVRISKRSIPKKTIDVMDDLEFERFASMIIKYKYKNEYEKARNILIARILLFSGITVSDLLSLKVRESFIVTDKAIFLRLENRKTDIDLPKNLLISHFNKYKELSLKEKKYDISSNALIKLTRQQIDIIVKELLEFAEIKRVPLTAQLIRYSFLVYIYNKRNADNEISFKTVQEISGIANKKELEKILNTFDKESVSIAKVFKDFV